MKSKEFEYFSYFRKNRAPGGGCAIFFNQTRFSISKIDISAPDNIETCWALAVPKNKDTKNMKIKRIAIGCYYISPRSRYKQQYIEHIIDSIHLLRARYENEVNFIIGGDFNRLNISDILDSYGAMKSIISVPTRKAATLEVLLTDLHTLYHPPTTLPPLEVDQDKLNQVQLVPVM